MATGRPPYHCFGSYCNNPPQRPQQQQQQQQQQQHHSRDGPFSSATMRIRREAPLTHLGELYHAHCLIPATTQTQLSRPMCSGYHIYMENRLWRKPLLMLTIQVWMATLCDTTYEGGVP